jgi:hypothetical protein
VLKLVAEAWGQFGNPEEGEHLPSQAVTRRLVKTQQMRGRNTYRRELQCV